MQQYLNEVQPEEENSQFTQYCEKVCAEYRARSDAYSLIAQINQLMKSVQKHRGYTMGLLSGDNSYQERFNALQKALKKRLGVLDLFGQNSDALITERDKSNLHFCWQTIANNWQEDNVNESLELHSHFVQQLLTMLSQISGDLGKPLLDTVELSETEIMFAPNMDEYRHSLSKVEVLNFVGKFLPENIEHIGKLRALSTHMAAQEVNGDSDKRKLRFLVDTARGQITILRSMSMRIKEISDGDYVALQTVFQTEMHLGLLLSQIENGILSSVATASDVQSRQIFVKATQVIDSYWLVVNKGFDLMRQWHEEEFDFWLATN